MCVVSVIIVLEEEKAAPMTPVANKAFPPPSPPPLLETAGSLSSSVARACRAVVPRGDEWPDFQSSSSFPLILSG